MIIYTIKVEKILMQRILVALLLGVLGACSANGGYSFDDDPLNNFADATFGKATGSDTRLLRAHAIIATLSAYGARTIEENKRRADQEEATSDAIVLLERIRRAKAELDKVRGVLDGGGTAWAKISATDGLPKYAKARGVVLLRDEIFLLAKAAVGPRYRIYRRSIAGIVASGAVVLLSDPKNLAVALKQAGTTFKLGDSLLDDIKKRLEEVATSSGQNRKKHFKHGWEVMAALIELSRHSLRKTAGTAS